MMLLFLAILCLYFLPSMIALYRGMERLADIVLLNGLLGWIPPLWVVLLLVSITQ